MYKFLEFSRENNPKHYLDYRRLKYEIFVKELGFYFLPHSDDERLVDEDPYDRVGKFVLARNNGDSIGIARGMNIRNDFPHKMLFLKHLAHESFINLQGKLSTINAVAVIKNYRGVKIKYQCFANKITVGQIILVILVRKLREEGAKIVILSTGIGRSSSFFRKLGFYTIDKPFTYQNYPKPIVNMALIINDKERFQKINSPMILASGNSILDLDETKAKIYFKLLNSQLEML